MRGRRATSASLLAALALAGCNALLGTDEGQGRSPSSSTSPDPSSSASDGGIARGTDGGEDASSPGEPPEDHVCGSWAERPEGPCTNRRVYEVEKNALGSDGLAIERATDGHVTIAVSRETLFTDESKIDLARIDDAHPDKPDIHSFGTDLRAYGPVSLAKWKDNHLLLAYQNVTDQQIFVVEVTAEGPLGDGDLIASNVVSKGYVSLATHAGTTAHIAYFDPSTNMLYSRSKASSAGQWSARATIDGPFVTDGLVGAGQVSLVSDEDGNAHVGYHYAWDRASAKPAFKDWNGTTWGPRKTTSSLSGEIGYSVAFGTFGVQRFAAYFGPTTAMGNRQLRFSSWQAGDTPSAFSVLDDNVSIPDALAPNTSVAMAVDRFGLVHLVVAIPNGGTTDIFYERQDPTNKTSWLTDLIDERPFKNGDPPTRVAITLDDHSRPHIAYYTGSDVTVRYAAIFD
jgi:hypothetical protein